MARNRVRYEELEGRRHAVVPVVMIKEGILEGSQGPVYYAAGPLKRSTPLWDGVPVVVYHPESGKASARAPDVYNASKIGTVFNTKFVKGSKSRLEAEAWIDVDRAEAVDPRILESVRRGEPVEVSTGLTAELDGESGAAALEIYPDHLAILPDRLGACSVGCGCGLMAIGNAAVFPPDDEDDDEEAEEEEQEAVSEDEEDEDEEDCLMPVSVPAFGSPARTKPTNEPEVDDEDDEDDCLQPLGPPKFRKRKKSDD